MRLPLEKLEDSVVWAERIPIGVLVMLLSIKVTEPTFCAVGPPEDKLKPRPQLFMEMDLYVQPN